MTKQERVNRIRAFLAEKYPLAGCELNYRKDYELVIAVMLSAQTTDQSVNRVTKKLFADFPSLPALAGGPLDAIEQDIHSIGLFHNKAINVMGIAKTLLLKFAGKVPMDKADLLTLPGVGVKTANVVRAELFHIPELAVDTHVARVSRRLGLCQLNDNVETIEKKLRQVFIPEEYIATHHRMIFFGRYFCTAKRPHCYACPLVDICREPNKNYKK